MRRSTPSIDQLSNSTTVHFTHMFQSYLAIIKCYYPSLFIHQAMLLAPYPFLESPFQSNSTNQGYFLLFTFQFNHDFKFKFLMFKFY